MTAHPHGNASDPGAAAPRHLIEHVSDQIRVTAGQAARLVRQKTPEPVLDTTGQVATAAKGNRTPLLALGAALVVFLLVRRGRGRK
ncbi:hypothetical protein ACFWAR_04850 [Streptomyces sp. NPDC059917]|uniref:hypothetical protein n=1 Tax=Streptomyces sp. NPDC059917 TaxID=3347002 RepID=UPI0036655025